MKVSANISASLDGRTSWADGRRQRLGSGEDLLRMRALRDRCDAVLVGGATFRAWPVPYAGAGPLLNVVLTRRGVLGQLPVDLERWQAKDVSLHVFTHSGAEDVPGLRSRGIRVSTCEQPSPGWVLDQLRDHGIGHVLVEGGGRLLHPLLAADRIDELYLTLCPYVIGGDGPKLVDGAALEIPAGFQQLNVETLGNEVFLHYKRIRNSIG